MRKLFIYSITGSPVKCCRLNIQITHINNNSDHPQLSKTESNQDVEQVQNQILDNDPVQIPCGHIFHEKCIRNWAISHNSCPVCRFQPKAFKDSKASETQTTETSADATVVSTLSSNVTDLSSYQSLNANDVLNQSENTPVVPSHNVAIQDEGDTGLV